MITTKRSLTAALVAFAVIAAFLAASTASAPSRSSYAGPKLTEKIAVAKATAAPEPRMMRPARDGKTDPKARYLVLIVLDGARTDYLSVSGIPHIQSLIRKGALYTDAFAGLLESETPSGHAAIGTGSQPSQNGILSFNWATSDNIPVDLFNPAKIRAGDMEKIMRNAHVPSIASLVHKQDPKAKVVSLGGHKYYAQDAMGGPDSDVIMYYTGDSRGRLVPSYVPGHAPPAGLLSDPSLTYKTSNPPYGEEVDLTMDLAVKTFDRMHQKVTLINEPEFDWPLGHLWGADASPGAVTKLMRRFDSKFGLLEDAYRRAGVLDKTVFVITADHGFSPVTHHVSDGKLKAAVSAAGTSIISDTYHTGAYLWIKDKSAAPKAAENIAHLQNRYIQSVYFKSVGAKGYVYLRATGPELFHNQGTEATNQFLLSTFKGGDSPDIVVFFTEGAASLPGDQASWKGDHGGADWDSQHMPLLISGPGVRAAQTSAYPARLIDIAPTALTLLGARTTGMQGIPLADGIQFATPAQRAEQAQQARVLDPLVRVMKDEAIQERRAG